MEQDIKLIAIDTSTAVMAGAACDHLKVIATVQTEAERNHSIHIMTNIKQLIEQSNWKVHDVTHYVVGIGPGSYTGVRIAVTAVKTLAWTTGTNIIPVSSLEALAYSAIENLQENDKKIAVIPIMDARRGQVYTALFSYDGTTDSWNRGFTDHIVMMDQWASQLADKLIAYDEVWIVGDVAMHQPSIVKLREEQSTPILDQQQLMTGYGVAQVGLKAMKHPESILSGDRLHTLAPNYAQLTEAEVKQNAKEKDAQGHG